MHKLHTNGANVIIANKIRSLKPVNVSRHSKHPSATETYKFVKSSSACLYLRQIQMTRVIAVTHLRSKCLDYFF